jgi:hypothetical protein
VETRERLLKAAYDCEATIFSDAFDNYKQIREAALSVAEEMGRTLQLEIMWPDISVRFTAPEQARAAAAKGGLGTSPRTPLAWRAMAGALAELRGMRRTAKLATKKRRAVS